MKREMETMPEFSRVLPTWNSMGFDYLTELSKFTKPWLGIFGEVDRVVPSVASVRNIGHYMNLSGNKNCDIAVIPQCGHALVNVQTKMMIRIDYLMVNWLNENIAPAKCVESCAVTYLANEGFLCFIHAYKDVHHPYRRVRPAAAGGCSFEPSIKTIKRWHTIQNQIRTASTTSPGSVSNPIISDRRHINGSPCL